MMIIFDSRCTVNALNQARLEANIKMRGDGDNKKKKWPSPYAIASGVLLMLSFLKYFYHPLRWLALGAVAVGIIPIALRAMSAVRNVRLDINVLALIAGDSNYFSEAEFVVTCQPCVSTTSTFHL